VKVVKFCIQEKVKVIAITRLQTALAKSTHELKQASYDFVVEELMTSVYNTKLQEEKDSLDRVRFV
jgi:hypothetical protein